jgi:hypothetical protein
MKNLNPPARALRPNEAPRRQNLYPRTLAAFCNAKVLGIYRCTACNWPHYGISEGDALRYVTFMNEYTASLDDQEATDIFGGKSLAIDHFRKCFFCASTCNKVVLNDNPDERISVSGRPIIVPLTV